MGMAHRVVVIGECLIELAGTAFGSLRQSFGGDTLNTAVYLARLCGAAATVHYATVLGRDPLSDAMLDRWESEGIQTDLTLRDSTRLPGLYQIQVDESGERSFLYWRQDSAARYLLQHGDFSRIRRGIENADLVYVSAISLAILPDEDRQQLIALLGLVAARGTLVAYDTNYRPRLWSSVNAARRCTTALLPAASFVFATDDDEQALWDDADPAATVARYRASYAKTLIIKTGAAGCLYVSGHEVLPVRTGEVPAVLDTTAAGDSFNAGFLAAWLSGADPRAACSVANTLAATVIQHPGAIIPLSAMPTLASLLSARIRA